MSRLNRLWTSIARYVKALEGMDDPVGDYMFSLGKRVDKLERDLSHLESQLHPRAGSDAVPDHGDSLMASIRTQQERAAVAGQAACREIVVTGILRGASESRNPVMKGELRTFRAKEFEDALGAGEV